MRITTKLNLVKLLLILVLVLNVSLPSCFAQTVKSENDQMENFSKIMKSLEQIKAEIRHHDEESSIKLNTWNPMTIISYVIGISGFTLAIWRFLSDRKNRQEEKKKIIKTESNIKWILGDIVERADTLTAKSLDANKIKTSNSWKKIKELVKKLSITTIPYSKDLKSDLGDQLNGYIAFMEMFFEKAEGTDEINISSVITATQKILDKHFPNFQKELDEAREAEFKHLEEEMEKQREEELESLFKYYEEELKEEQMLAEVENEMWEAQNREYELEDEVLDKERETEEEKFTSDADEEEEK